MHSTTRIERYRAGTSATACRLRSVPKAHEQPRTVDGGMATWCTWGRDWHRGRDGGGKIASCCWSLKYQ
eukprot:scaffold22740_cov129-Isochrysis_galbana.AAC.4